MNNIIISTSQIRMQLTQLAANCRVYKEQGNRTRFINEVGALRGAMYIADIIDMDYPDREYYDLYIKPAYEMMKAEEE